MVICAICRREHDPVAVMMTGLEDCLSCGGGLINTDDTDPEHHVIDRLSKNHDPDVAAHMADLLRKANKPNKEETKMTTTRQPRIRSDIQAKVDDYIELDAAMKKLQAELKKLRPEIEEYMENRNLTVIPGSTRGSVSLQPRNMPVINSRFTSYEVEHIEPLLSPQARKQCIVKAVDKDVLDLLVKTGQAPKEVQQHKIVKPSISFIISHK